MGSSRSFTSLKSTLHPVHWIRLVYLTSCWPSSSTLFVALTLIVSVASKSYLYELIVIIHGSLGCSLLSITIPCREREPIARLVNFLLTSKSVRLKPYSLDEACLKIGLPG
jgi:hypothetical protein